jgi:hypothetical protein
MNRFDVLHELAGIACPTLVCVGELDPITPVVAAREIVDALPHSRLEILEGAGHFPWKDVPDRYWPLLVDFVTGLGSGRRRRFTVPTIRTCGLRPRVRLNRRVDPTELLPVYDPTMCRNIHTLFNFDPEATDEEIRGAALQYVRKISGFTKPSQANADAFERAVDEVAASSKRLLDSLVTAAAPKDRVVEAERARARAAKRYAAA